ncbi:MAG: TetR/AcrR family transcriptional regulator [Deltaproteobacteria bacterium]|nr:TetR/AcrR family transcriptional regulator [Deltaproteobacteria bacterium]
MNYAQFRRRLPVTGKNICEEIYRRHRGEIRIKKAATAVHNLEKIFQAALKISNRRGFQAMSMRDLSRETGLSTGALYAYFSSKEELLKMMQEQRRGIVARVLDQAVAGAAGPAEKLAAAIRAHLYLSEALQPWFYFSFMEAKNLPPSQKKAAVAGSRSTEKLLADIIADGVRTGVFTTPEPLLTASLIKAMLQDWYLKRGKYRARRLTVDRYAEFTITMVMAFLIPGIGASPARGKTLDDRQG